MSEVALGPTKNPGSIQVIERMMSLLDALADAPDAASLKQLAAVTELHSFDPCLACSTHVMSPDGQEMTTVKVR